MEQLPVDIEEKLERLPIVPFDGSEEFQNVIFSNDFNNIFDYYSKNYMPDVVKSKPELYQRVSLYLTLTNQDTSIVEQTDEVLYRRPCPTIHEFLTSDFYHGRLSATMYPYWKDKLEYIFRDGSPIRQVIYQGCIGSGKSTIARKAMVYMLYKILCLRYPRAIYNIDEDSTIAAFIISVNLKQVFDTNVLPFVKLLENMPCFQRVMSMRSFDNFDLDNPNCPIPFFLEKSTATIFFPNNIILTSGSQINHTVGYNIPLCFCLTGETKVKTECGMVKFIDLLEDYKKGVLHKTFSVNETGEFVESNIINVKQTGECADLIRIWLTDEHYVDCTYNHKFLLKNVNKHDKNVVYINGLPYKEAQFLTIEDELVGF